MNDIVELAQKLAAELRRQNTRDTRHDAAFVASVVKAIAEINFAAEPLVAGHPYRAPRSRSRREEHDALDDKPVDFDDEIGRAHV